MSGDNGLLQKLYGSGGLGGDVHEAAVDAADFVDDAARYFIKDIPGDAGAVGSHKVYGADCS